MKTTKKKQLKFEILNASTILNRVKLISLHALHRLCTGLRTQLIETFGNFHGIFFRIDSLKCGQKIDTLFVLLLRVFCHGCRQQL